MMNKISLTGGTSNHTINRKELTMRLTILITLLCAAFFATGCLMDDGSIPEPGAANSQGRDLDDDGFIDEEDGGDDCNDHNDMIYPGAPEQCDGKDNDCDGHVDEGNACVSVDDTDRDNDGYDAINDGGNDCDDYNNTRHPGATERCGNNVDDDCDGSVDEGCEGNTDHDLDNDGYVDENDGGNDCDDYNAYVHPGATEICNGRDDDCDGSVDEDGVCGSSCSDCDSDGYNGVNAGGNDCDDANASVHPGSTEICNGRDDDCDGQVDENSVCGICAPGTAEECTCSGGTGGLQYCNADGMSYGACQCNTGTGGTGNVSETVPVTFVYALPDGRTADGVKIEGLVDVTKSGQDVTEWLNICDSGLSQHQVTGTYSCTKYLPPTWASRGYNVRVEYPNLACVMSTDYSSSNCPPGEISYFVGESNGEVVWRGNFSINGYDMRQNACVVDNDLNFVGGYNAQPDRCM